MTGHHPWHTIRKKSERCDSLSPSSKTSCGLFQNHPGLHTSEDRTVTWGYKTEMPTSYSSDVGDEHVERAPDPSPPPTQPPPKPVDARRSVEPPAYRYKPNLERLTRRPFVNQRDREQVEAMLRHTRPIVEQIRDPLVEKIVFPKADEIDHQYPYQTEAVEQIEEAVDLLNGIIQTQVKKLREYEEMMAIDHERIMSLQQQLASCNVDLHNSKQHQLGLMCAEQTDKLEAIRKRLSEIKGGDSYWLALDIEDILDGTSE